MYYALWAIHFESLPFSLGCPQYIKKLEARLDKLSYFYMAEYCEIFENSKFSAWAHNSLLSSHKVLVTTEKVKTVIDCYFLLPDFKYRGHPRSHSS